MVFVNQHRGEFCYRFLRDLVIKWISNFFNDIQCDDWGFAVWKMLTVANSLYNFKSSWFDIRPELLFVVKGSKIANDSKHYKLIQIQYRLFVIVVKCLKNSFILEKGIQWLGTQKSDQILPTHWTSFKSVYLFKAFSTYLMIRFPAGFVELGWIYKTNIALFRFFF